MAGRIDGEMVEGMRQLEPAAADPGVVLALDGERRVGCQAQSRLVDPAGAAKDVARHDEGLGPCAGFGETAFDDELIEAFSGHLTGVALSAARPSLT